MHNQESVSYVPTLSDNSSCYWYIYLLSTIHTHSITPKAVADVENQIQRKVKVLETSWT